MAQQSGLRAIQVFLSYLGIVQGQREAEPVRRLLVASLGPRGEEVYMSWQDQLIATGEAQGVARGLAQQRAMFLSLLQQRFGALSPQVTATVEAADTDQLTTWTAGFFSAPTPEALLGL